MRAFHTYDTACVVLPSGIKKHPNLFLKHVRDFYAYPPLHLLSVPIRKQGERLYSSPICAALCVADRT